MHAETPHRPDPLLDQAFAWIAERDVPERYLCLQETLRRGAGFVRLIGPDGLLVEVSRNGALLAAPLTDRFARAVRPLADSSPIIGLVDAAFADLLAGEGAHVGLYTLWCYPACEPADRPDDGHPLSFRLLGPEHAETVARQYRTMPEEDTVQHVRAGLVWGGFDERGELVGFIGEHDESSMGMLEVYPAHRKRGYASQLEAMQIRRFLAAGRVPFCQVAVGNIASETLQRKLGLAQVPGVQCWIEPERPTR